MEACETPPCYALGWQGGDVVGRLESEDAGPPMEPPPSPPSFSFAVAHNAVAPRSFVSHSFTDHCSRKGDNGPLQGMM